MVRGAGFRATAHTGRAQTRHSRSACPDRSRCPSSTAHTQPARPRRATWSAGRACSWDWRGRSETPSSHRGTCRPLGLHGRCHSPPGACRVCRRAWCAWPRRGACQGRVVLCPWCHSLRCPIAPSFSRRVTIQPAPLQRPQGRKPLAWPEPQQARQGCPMMGSQGLHVPQAWPKCGVRSLCRVQALRKLTCASSWCCVLRTTKAPPGLVAELLGR